MAIADQYFTFYRAMKEKVSEVACQTVEQLSECYPSTSTSPTPQTATSIVATATDDLIFELTVELSRLTAGKYSTVVAKFPPEDETERPQIAQTRSGRTLKRPKHLQNFSDYYESSLSPSPRSRRSSAHKVKGALKRLHRSRRSPVRRKKRTKSKGCVCQQCGKHYSCAKNLRRHQLQVHSLGRAPTFVCRWPSCTANFSSIYKSNAVIHVRTAHLDLPAESTGCPKQEMAKWYVVKV